jgi:hypothetical protein
VSGSQATRVTGVGASIRPAESEPPDLATGSRLAGRLRFVANDRRAKGG